MVKKNKLIVIKIGTTSLTKKGGELCPDKIRELVRQIGDLKDQGHSIILVSSGAIAAGFRRLGYNERPKTVAARQAAAAVGQGLLMEEYTKLLLERGYIGAQILLTRLDFSDHQRYKNVYQALSLLLKKGAVPIINENDSVAVEELCFGDNDTLAAQVAGMIHGDLLILLTDINGLYTADPKKDPRAKPIDIVEKIDSSLEEIASGTLSSTGTGGMKSKIAAAKIANLAGVPMLICRAGDEDSIIKAVKGQACGTYFKTNQSKLKNHLQWLAFCSLAEGILYIDNGAVNALEREGSSLLPSGVKSLEGSFPAGAVVEVKNPEKGYIGKGITNYSSEDLKNILQALNTQEEIILSKREIIHRNNWLGAKKTKILVAKRRKIND